MPVGFYSFTPRVEKPTSTEGPISTVTCLYKEIKSFQKWTSIAYTIVIKKTNQKLSKPSPKLLFGMCNEFLQRSLFMFEMQ